MPSGIFGEAERPRHLAVIESWASALQESAGATALERVRFGGAEENATADTLVDPIVLCFEAGEIGPGPVRVEIFGKTEPLILDRRGSLVLEWRNPKTDGWEPVRQLKKALRGFLDAVALAASGLAADSEHAAWLCIGNGEEQVCGVHRFAPISQEEALAFLRALVADLLSRVHAYLLPCEATFLKQLEEPRPDIAACIRKVLRHETFSSSYGPIRHPDRYPVPSDSEAEAIIERRWGLFFAKRLAEPAEEAPVEEQTEPARPKRGGAKSKASDSKPAEQPKRSSRTNPRATR
jgi:hypothetical protein